MRVQPGASVSKGQELALLENVELEDRHRELVKEKAKQLLEISTNVAIENVAVEQTARERLRTIDTQLADVRRQMEQLRILSPADGVVVEPPPIPEPTTEFLQDRLSQWSGTTLDPRNRGCFLKEGTHILSVAPNSNLEAILFAGQSDRNEVSVGQSVELKFTHLPHQTYTGTVGRIADRDLLFAPPMLSNKYGGELPTVTDKQGRERLAGAVYRTTVLLAEDTGLLRPGMTGRGRLVVTRRSAAGWLWRYLRSTLHFRL
jgi:putative peptide zinc metalloprotease protein